MKHLSTTALTIYSIIAFCFIYLPVVVLVLFSFTSKNIPLPPIDSFSIKWYISVLESDQLISALKNSLFVAVISSFIVTVIAFLAAYGIARKRPLFSATISWLIMAPLTVSYLVIGLGMLVMFKHFGIPKSIWAIIAAHVVINMPIAFGMIIAQMGEHQANIERAARDLGAREWQVLLFVTTPMLWPALFAAFCISATLSWDEFIIALLLSHTDVTLPVEIWNMMQRGFNVQTNAVGSLVFLISILLFVIFELIVFRRNKWSNND